MCRYNLYLHVERLLLLFLNIKHTDCGIYSSNTDVSALIVQELCESQGGRPELSVLTSLLVSVDVKLY